MGRQLDKAWCGGGVKIGFDCVGHDIYWE